MALVKLQGKSEIDAGIIYTFDPDTDSIGKGGMGEVFHGWRYDSYGGCSEVAIKRVHRDLAPNVKGTIIARAQMEASVQLRNDCLVEMYGFIEKKDKDYFGQEVTDYYVISEYLDGVSLSDVLEGKYVGNDGSVNVYAQHLYSKYIAKPYDFALHIVRHLLTGLTALHDAGYIHRDIDPSNIMVTSDEKIKLIDFGIAKSLTNQNKKLSTVVGQFMGKAHYAAPELVRGLTDSQTYSTDLYAVGILLYQLITGEKPFDGDTIIVMEQQLKSKIPLNKIKQKAIRKVIDKATQKMPNSRYHSASEFRVALDAIKDLPYPDKPINIKVVGAVSAAVVIAGMAVVIISNSETSPPAPPEPKPAPSTLTAQVDPPKEKTDREKYSETLVMLKDANRAKEGWDRLNMLTKSKDDNVRFNALFLKSRICFKSGQEGDLNDVPDSIKQMQRSLEGIVQINNKESHELLLEAVRVNPNDYHAQYELGCNYKSKGKRGAEFDKYKAKEHLIKAQRLAEIANDKEYMRKISQRASNL